MNLIEKQWERFTKVVVGKNSFDTEQINLMRNCFYSGALAMINVLMDDEECSMMLVSNKDVRKFVSELTEEISQFVHS